MSTALDSLTGVSIGLTLKATVTKKQGNNANAASNNVYVKINNANSFTLGNTTPGQFNEVINTIITAAAGATVNQTLNGSMTDAGNQPNATLTKILAWCVQLLPTADPSGVGTACTSITCGANATPWIGILNATGTVTMNNGASWMHFDPAGLTVGATDIMKILNNDGVHTMAVMLTIFGIG